MNKGKIIKKEGGEERGRGKEEREEGGDGKEERERNKDERKRKRKGQGNNGATTSEKTSKKPKGRPIRVTKGIMEGRRQCLNTTHGSRTPFAREVLM